MAKRSSLTQEAKKCSWCSFYTNQSCCRYEEVLNNDAEFLNVQNRSFFSVSDIESIDIKIECYTDEERGVRGIEKGKESLKGTGYLTLRPGCQGAYQNQIIRPSITKIPEIIDENEPVYKVYSSTKKEKEKSDKKKDQPTHLDFQIHCQKSLGRNKSYQ